MNQSLSTNELKDSSRTSVQRPTNSIKVLKA